MRRTSVVFAIGLAAAFVIAGTTFTWAASTPSALPSGAVEAVLFATGDVIHGLPPTDVNFSVPAEGGVLVGEAWVDHSSVSLGVFLPGHIYMCPAIPADYTGGPWTYTVNESLVAGQYLFGAFCSGLGNATVTQSVEVLYP